MAAATTMQFPTAGWQAHAPGEVLLGYKIGANMNVTTDQAIPIVFPSVHYFVTRIILSSASISLTTASGGVYAAASKTTALASNQAFSTLTAAVAGAAGSAFSLTLAVGATTAVLNQTTLYLSLTTAQGSAATANIRIFGCPLYS